MKRRLGRNLEDMLVDMITDDLVDRYRLLSTEEARSIARSVVESHKAMLRGYGDAAPEHVARTRVYRVLLRKAREKAYYATRRYLAGNPLDACHVLAGCSTRECVERNADVVLRKHVSTYERLGYAAELYRTVLRYTGGWEALADYGCGLNPLLLLLRSPMLPRIYYAIDVNRTVIDTLLCLKGFFGENGVELVVVRGDICVDNVFPEADVSLIFKTLHAVERLRRGCAARVLDHVRSSYVAITEPAVSLTRGEDILGREKAFLRKVLGSMTRAHRIVYEGVVGEEYLVVIEKT